MSREEWRPVAEFGQYYEVSSLGRVKRVAPGQGARAGRLMSTAPDADGYVRMHLRVNGKRYPRPLHRLVLEAFRGPRPKHHDCDHINRNPSDNRLRNLRYLHRSENRLGAAKLNSIDANNIRRRRANGERVVDLAEAFGVCERHIYFILSRRYWK